MSNAQTIVKKAQSYIGYNCNHFISAMADYGATYGQAWCAYFVSTVFRECGYTDILTPSGGAGTIARVSVPAGKGTRITSNPQAGDVIMYLWYGDNPTDQYYASHVALVEKVDNNYVYTIEGNANGTNTSSTVCRKTWSKNNSQIRYYYRPNYSEKEKQTYKIYLSPSNQDGNTYATGNTNEMEVCYKIATETSKCLKEYGFEVKVANKGQSNPTSISESNSWGADLHIPIHTNAGGSKGCLAILYSYDSENVNVAKPILSKLKDVIPSKTSKGYFTYADIMGNKSAQLKELSDTDAIGCYLECEFHDNKEYAQWLINNTSVVAKAICDGVCEYYGVSKKEDNEMNFKKGDKSDGVLAYKSLLMQAKAFNLIKSSVDTSNSFGTGTYNATVEIQKLYKLEVDGIAGNKTITALRNAVNNKIEVAMKGHNALIDDLAKKLNELKV